MSERTYKKIKINSDWINDNIIKRDWQRSLYPSRVNKFASYIRDKQFECSLITVAEDKDTGELVLLDGQHKLEAIKKEDIEIEMDFCIYKNLDEEKEIFIYRMLNEVKQFRVVDDIRTYLGRHDWLDAFFDSSFPIEVSLHGGINSIKIGDILIVLYSGIRDSPKRSSLSRNKLPLFLKELDATRFREMKDFCILYKKCFGNPQSDNWVYRNSIMTIIMKIWYSNKDIFSEEEFIKRFKPIEKKDGIRQLSTVGGFDQTSYELLINKIYQASNKGYSKNKFIKFWKE